MPEAPRRAWDRFSGSHFAGLNDHDSFVEACNVLREEIASKLREREIDSPETDEVLDEVFGKVEANA